MQLKLYGSNFARAPNLDYLGHRVCYCFSYVCSVLHFFFFLSEVFYDLAGEVRKDVNVSSEEEDDVVLDMIDENHHAEVESEVENLELDEKCPNQAETSSAVVDELETSTDLSKQLEA